MNNWCTERSKVLSLVEDCFLIPSFPQQSQEPQLSQQLLHWLVIGPNHHPSQTLENRPRPLAAELSWARGQRFCCIHITTDLFPWGQRGATGSETARGSPPPGEKKVWLVLPAADGVARDICCQFGVSETAILTLLCQHRLETCNLYELEKTGKNKKTIMFVHKK